MGHGGNWRAPPVVDAVRHMIETAVSAGRPVVMPVFAPDEDECRDLIATYRDLGVSTFVIGSDKIMVAHAFDRWVRRLAAS